MLNFGGVIGIILLYYIIIIKVADMELAIREFMDMGGCQKLDKFRICRL